MNSHIIIILLYDNNIFVIKVEKFVVGINLNEVTTIHKEIRSNGIQTFNVQVHFRAKLLN